MNKQERYNFIDASKFTMATIKEVGMHSMSCADENSTMEDLEKSWRLYVIPLYLTIYDNLKELVGDNNFAIVSHSYKGDVDVYAIMLKIFNDNGDEILGETLINQSTASSQKTPFGSPLETRDFFFFWQSHRQLPSPLTTTPRNSHGRSVEELSTLNSGFMMGIHL